MKIDTHRLYAPGVVGCTDGGCLLVDNSEGMHTNGGCSCATELNRLRAGRSAVRTILFLRKQLREEDAEIKRLRDALHDLYFAGKWTLERGILSKEEEIALWQRVKDITGWSETEGIGK